MMRGGRRMLITVWSSSRTSGCSSQGLSEMHWEGKERKIRLHPTSQTLKRSRPCSAPKWGASQMSPKPKLCPPHLVMLLLLLQAKAKFILAPTQTHTNTELNSTKKCPIQRSQLLLAFPSPFTLCFHLGIYQWRPSIAESKEQDLCKTSGMDWANCDPEGHSFCDLCSPLWLLLQQICLSLPSSFKSRSTSV